MMTTKHLSLKHILRPSNKTDQKAPCLIMLHGYGSDEKDLFSFVSELDPQYLVVSVRAPIPMQPFGNAWYGIDYDAAGIKSYDEEQAEVSRDLIIKFVDEVIENYHADPHKITLFGFSQGAILSYAAALSFPKKISQVVAMSGYIPENLLIDKFEENDFSRLRIYSSHGSADQVVPVAWDRKTKAFLDKLKIDSQYSEFPVGHGVSPDNFKEIVEWLK